MAERRHRLYEKEIPEVILGLHLRLKQLLEKREDAKTAETTYNCMYRLLEDKPGRPKYPKFSWELLSYLVEDCEEHNMARIEEMRKRNISTQSN